MAAPPELLWSLIRNNNASVIKRDHYSQPFSKEKFNLRNLHSMRDSGFVSKKGLDISPAPDGKGVIVSTKKKKVLSPGSNSLVLNKHFRKSVTAVTSITAGTRRDLVRIARGRFSRIKRSQTKKPVAIRKRQARYRRGKGKKDLNLIENAPPQTTESS
eukprot:TRINITY_DN5148_c0_g1_i1.p1 TRINITY_DN5148_c0_g1~~TRINITY_DN5148_c0_g1_i1.p1  ORF type:complete len:174 (-),score=28.91 TRINITY_DN5148_c0_g1_i1:109-582(-)